MSIPGINQWDTYTRQMCVCSAVGKNILEQNTFIYTCQAKPFSANPVNIKDLWEDIKQRNNRIRERSFYIDDKSSCQYHSLWVRNQTKDNKNSAQGEFLWNLEN